jgi:hypothetical protein
MHTLEVLECELQEPSFLERSCMDHLSSIQAVQFISFS